MKTITALTAQQKNKKRVNLFLDGEYFCSLDAFTVLSERLKVGVEVDEKRLAELSFKSEYSSALEKALGYISKSMHTKMQIITYLKGKDYSGKVIAAVIDKLTEYGYVDDEAFARNYFKDKSSAYGAHKIIFDLKTKGVDEKTARSVAEEFSDDAEPCKRVAEKYLKGKPLDYPAKQKCYRYLASKGFDFDTINRTLDALGAGENDEDNYS